MKRLTHSLLMTMAVLIAVGTGSGMLAGRAAAAISVPVPTVIARNCTSGFFGLEPWYHFMPDELGVPKRGDTPADPCAVRCFNIFNQAQANACGQKASDIPGVFLALIDDLLRISGLVAVFFVLKGSFEYVGSRGNAERTASAQATIMAALTGLAVSIAAVALVSYLGHQLG